MIFFSPVKVTIKYMGKKLDLMNHDITKSLL